MQQLGCDVHVDVLGVEFLERNWGGNFVLSSSELLTLTNGLRCVDGLVQAQDHEVAAPDCTIAAGACGEEVKLVDGEGACRFSLSVFDGDNEVAHATLDRWESLSVPQRSVFSVALLAAVEDEVEVGAADLEEFRQVKFMSVWSPVPDLLAKRCTKLQSFHVIVGAWGCNLVGAAVSPRNPLHEETRKQMGKWIRNLFATETVALCAGFGGGCRGATSNNVT